MGIFHTKDLFEQHASNNLAKFSEHLILIHSLMLPHT